MMVAAGEAPMLGLCHLPRRPAGVATATAHRRPAPPSADAIEDALVRSGFSAGGAAAALGLSRHQLYRLVRRYGIRAKGGDR